MKKKLKELFKDRKKLFILGIAVMVLILILTFFLVEGCSNQKKDSKKELKKASIKTSISEDGVDSYRAKISIRNKKNNELNQNYIVYNSKNEKYIIDIFNGNESNTITIDKAKDDNENDLKYDYTNTDLFLEGLKSGKNIKTELKTINDEKYTIYSFDVDNNTINNISKVFDISTSFDGTGIVYIDSKGKVYLVIYDNEDFNISASYTRFNELNR